MSTLTQAQILRHTELLNQLSQCSEQRDAAAARRDEAQRLWQFARLRYANFHAQIVTEFGEEGAPRWIDAIHGPRVTAGQVQAVDSTMGGLA